MCCYMHSNNLRNGLRTVTVPHTKSGLHLQYFYTMRTILYMRDVDRTRNVLCTVNECHPCRYVRCSPYEMCLPCVQYLSPEEPYTRPLPYVWAVCTIQGMFSMSTVPDY